MLRPWEGNTAHHARLARRAAAGDRDAFVALYRELYPPVAAFVGRRVRAPADADDAVSQTFQRLLEALPRLDDRRGAVLGYALAIARNAVADQHRARGGVAELEAEPPAPGPGPEAVLAAREAGGALDAAVAALGEEERRLLELRFGDGLKHAEIAVLLGAREAAVKQRLSRLLRALRSALDPATGGAGEEAP